VGSTPARQERKDLIVDQAMVIIEESGRSSLNMATLAASAKISRVWLYQHFPDMDHVLEAIMERVYITTIHNASNPPVSGTEVNRYLHQRAPGWLKMPTAAAIVALESFSQVGLKTASVGPVVRSVQQALLTAWVGPLVGSGVNVEDAIAAIATLHTGTLGIIVTHKRGLVSEPVATERLHGLIDAVIPVDWVLGDMPREAVCA
jgi:AcrR family transcriptional regulator